MGRLWWECDLPGMKQEISGRARTRTQLPRGPALSYRAVYLRTGGEPAHRAHLPAGLLQKTQGSIQKQSKTGRTTFSFSVFQVLTNSFQAIDRSPGILTCERTIVSENRLQNLSNHLTLLKIMEPENQAAVHLYAFREVQLWQSIFVQKQYEQL